MRSTVLIATSVLIASSAAAQIVVPAQAGTYGTQAKTQRTPPMDARFRGYDAPDLAAFASEGAFFVYSSQRKSPRVLDLDADEGPKSRDTVVIKPRATENALAVALSRAWKRGFVEEGVEETRNVLLECQHETSVVLTTPLMRSDAQQAHCFRF
ncbi:hypothetical protein H3H37_00330 [Duganella sp. LX20W]|uniref:Uncharacterized protein n=1 Tax=Rugamonas brunnea TaxID=2758569 RepID=A0A7W2EN56_9BURK|nr:hypothetical protein [Rugamonas brunnea]MBA5635515.1 hypothetical protein [Rugamonas brunnea]